MQGRGFDSLSHPTLSQTDTTMSTDTPLPPLIPKHANTYFYAPGYQTKWGSESCTTCRRAPEGQGQRLPYQIIPKILRAFRSKYAPHVGKKQIVKQNVIL